MKILFVHNAFPAQYQHVVKLLASKPEVSLAAIGSSDARAVAGVKLQKYRLVDADATATHPFARRFDLECRRAEQVVYGLSSLIGSGFVPDVILAHPGWGETLPLRTFFPKARLLIYCEFYYGRDGRDVGFDPEFPATGLDGAVALDLKNAATLLALADSDGGVAPTEWQRSTFPGAFRDRISVIHEGVDVDLAKPDPKARLTLPSGRELTRADKVVTFVARNLEPLRGYHIFMRALPEILRRHPDAEILIIGGDSVSYGLRPPRGTTWKSLYLKEVAGAIDRNRVHFLGRVPHATFLKALQVSSAHVYLTYPFVLSWSLIEALSAGCVVIGSDTAPVREVIDGKNGHLVPFFDIAGLAKTVNEVLARPERFKAMRTRARKFAIANFDTRRVCAPKLAALLGCP